MYEILADTRFNGLLHTFLRQKFRDNLNELLPLTFRPGTDASNRWRSGENGPQEGIAGEGRLCNRRGGGGSLCQSWHVKRTGMRQYRTQYQWYYANIEGFLSFLYIPGMFFSQSGEGVDQPNPNPGLTL